MVQIARWIACLLCLAPVAAGAYPDAGAVCASAAGAAPGEYGIGARCIGVAERAPPGLAVTPPQAPLPVEVHVDGQPSGWLYLCCGVDEELCRDVPSSALARRLGLDRDCGRVNARELAACLGVRVETPENYILHIWTR